MPLPPVEGVPVARGVRVAAGIWQQVAKRRAELRRDQGELEATWILGVAFFFGLVSLFNSCTTLHACASCTATLRGRYKWKQRRSRELKKEKRLAKRAAHATAAAANATPQGGAAKRKRAEARDGAMSAMDALIAASNQVLA